MVWTTPRTWVASEVVTATLLNTHVRDNLNAINGYVVKTADQSVTSSTTLVNDNELTYTIGATGTYLFDAWVYSTGASAGDIKLGFTFPTGTCHFAGFGANNAALTTGSSGSGEFIARLSATSGTTTIPFAESDSASSPLVALVHGILIATATGTLRMQFAQNASSATSTTVKAGSHLLVRQVA